MTRAAELRTEAPGLQALFDQDWTSGKYRRPKCSKSDFYAGWLVAYERFINVAPAEKVTAVEAPKVKPSQPAVEKYEQYSVVCDGEWAPTCGGDKDVHERSCCAWFWDDKAGRRRPASTIYGPVRTNETLHVMRNLCGCEESHTKLVTVYQGALPLKHDAPKGPPPNRNNPHCSGQAIPDHLIRKLAIMAGRPKIAP